MSNIKRVFLIVLDSVGIGSLPDYKNFDDEQSNTFGALVKSNLLEIPTLTKIGFCNIDGVNYKKEDNPLGSFLRLQEISNGKDTTAGHFEICGEITRTPFVTFPNGFPKNCVEKLEEAFGTKILCNKPYSGTEVIKDYGEQSIREKRPIVYTSADSVLQIATHESVFSVEQLYDMCKKAREIMQGDWKVNRIIARPFIGEYPFVRSKMRKDFTVLPKNETALDILYKNNFDVLSVGKIFDIFSGRSITKNFEAHDNDEVETALFYAQKENFEGLCFANFNDFDSKYGHRNNVEGYALCLNKFDKFLKLFLQNMRDDDVLFITADHGNDPSTESTDHSREYTPCVVCGKNIKPGINLHTKEGLFNITTTILDMFNLKSNVGESFYSKIKIV